MSTTNRVRDDEFLCGIKAKLLLDVCNISITQRGTVNVVRSLLGGTVANDRAAEKTTFTLRDTPPTPLNCSEVISSNTSMFLKNTVQQNKTKQRSTEC